MARLELYQPNEIPLHPQNYMWTNFTPEALPVYTTALKELQIVPVEALSLGIEGSPAEIMPSAKNAKRIVGENPQLPQVGYRHPSEVWLDTPFNFAVSEITVALEKTTRQIPLFVFGRHPMASREAYELGMDLYIPEVNRLLRRREQKQFPERRPQEPRAVIK